MLPSVMGKAIRRKERCLHRPTVLGAGGDVAFPLWVYCSFFYEYPDDSEILSAIHGNNDVADGNSDRNI